MPKRCPISEFSPCKGEECSWWAGEACAIVALAAKPQMLNISAVPMRPGYGPSPLTGVIDQLKKEATVRHDPSTQR